MPTWKDFRTSTAPIRPSKVTLLASFETTRIGAFASGSLATSALPPSSADGTTDSGQGSPSRTWTRSMGSSGTSPLPRFRKVSCLSVRCFSAPPQLVKVALNSGVSRTTSSSGAEGGTAGAAGTAGAGAWAPTGAWAAASFASFWTVAAGAGLPFFGMANSFHAKRISTDPSAANMMRLLSFKTYLPSSA